MFSRNEFILDFSEMSGNLISVFISFLVELIVEMTPNLLLQLKIVVF